MREQRLRRGMVLAAVHDDFNWMGVLPRLQAMHIRLPHPKKSSFTTRGEPI